MRITKTYVDRQPLPQPVQGKPSQTFHRDTSIPGFGLRVTSGGAKSFIVEKRIKGRVKRITIGRYGNLTVEQARREAMQLLGQVASGKDPIAEKQVTLVQSVSLQYAFADYLNTRKDLKQSTIGDYTRSINTGFKDWLTKPLNDITKDMVEIRHAELGKKSPARANNAMRVLRAIFNHTISKFEDLEGDNVLRINPVNRLSQNRAWYKVKPRQTLIKPHQLKDWYDATQQLVNTTTRDYLHLLLFTGLRRSEAAALRWEDIDFKDRTLIIPTTKNHQAHTLPLSDFLYELLHTRYEDRFSPFVFPSDSERGHLVEPRTAVQRVSTLSEIPFTLHDLRRTFITIAESLDIPGYALKRLLNHKNSSDVTAGYIVSNVERLREPMKRISDFIEGNIKK